MSAKSNDVIVDHSGLLNDIVLTEDDLTKEAKDQFDYHTKIVDAINQNRRYSTICLLACDPASRAPFFVDMCAQSVPPLSRSHVVEREQQMLMMKQQAEMRAQLVGRPSTFHLSHPIFPIEEDAFILVQAGVDPIVAVSSPLNQSEPTAWFYDKTNKDYAFAYHELSLRVTNSVDKPSSNWLLKAPVKNLFLDPLFRQYPNAAVVMIHRDLVEVVASFCRIVFESLFFVDIDNSVVRQTVITRALQGMDKMVEGVVEFRVNKSGKYAKIFKNIIDVYYEDLMNDPVAIVRKIYDHFGLRWSQEFETAMHAWLRDNPQGKLGRNTYSLSEFDLTHDDIVKRYGTYIDLFLRPSSSS